MSLLVTSSVAVAYAGAVVGLHRLAVYRRRALAQGFSTLRWLDWSTLLEGLAPPGDVDTDARVPTPPEGGPAPERLRRRVEASAEPRRQALVALVGGAPLEVDALAAAGFSGGEAAWLQLLSRVRSAPLTVLEHLQRTPAESVAEVYLREWLVLRHGVGVFDLEWAVFGVKRRLNHALGRFGDGPALYFARAGASGLLGFTGAALDDLARAVYFSGGAGFYVQAVLGLPFIEDARPALSRACRDGLAR